MVHFRQPAMQPTDQSTRPSESRLAQPPRDRTHWHLKVNEKLQCQPVKLFLLFYFRKTIPNCNPSRIHPKMCKIWNIKYSCDHIFSFRLSTCRESVTTQVRQGDTSKVLCHPSPALSFYDKSQLCGPCQRRPEEESLAQWMDAVRKDSDENMYVPFQMLPRKK